MDRWTVYEYLKQHRYMNECIPNAKMLYNLFPDADMHEIQEGIEEYKAARWIQKDLKIS